MPTDGDVKVSSEEARVLRVTSLPYHHLRRFGSVPKWRRGQLCRKKVKPKDGDAATAVRYFILFLPRALRIILHKKRVDPLCFAL